MPPESPPPFVPTPTAGRALRALEDGLRRSTSPLLLVGESGTGKTALLKELARRRREAGVAVVLSPFLHLPPSGAAEWLLSLVDAPFRAGESPEEALARSLRSVSGPLDLFVDEIQRTPVETARWLQRLARPPRVTLLAAGTPGAALEGVAAALRPRVTCTLPPVLPDAEIEVLCDGLLSGPAATPALRQRAARERERIVRGAAGLPALLVTELGVRAREIALGLHGEPGAEPTEPARVEAPPDADAVVAPPEPEPLAPPAPAVEPPAPAPVAAPEPVAAPVAVPATAPAPEPTEAPEVDVASAIPAPELSEAPAALRAETPPPVVGHRARTPPQPEPRLSRASRRRAPRRPSPRATASLSTAAVIVATLALVSLLRVGAPPSEPARAVSAPDPPAPLAPSALPARRPVVRAAVATPAAPPAPAVPASVPLPAAPTSVRLPAAPPAVDVAAPLPAVAFEPPAALAVASAEEVAAPVVAAAKTPPEPALIRVQVNAHPWAFIRVDGVHVGATPLGHLRLPAGPHRFEAEFPDGRRAHRRVEIGPETRFVSLP